MLTYLEEKKSEIVIVIENSAQIDFFGIIIDAIDTNSLPTILMLMNFYVVSAKVA